MKRLFLILISILCCSCSHHQVIIEEQPIDAEQQQSEEIIPADAKVRFVAAGDNLIHGAVYYDAYIRHGEYVFDDMYEEIKPYIEDAEVAYINQETILGGSELGLSHYPQFNSPQEVGEALVRSGFDWIACSSNHSMDAYEAGIMNSQNFWDQYPDVITTGLNRSVEEMNELKFIERNGVKIGVLGYTYGTNGIALPVGKEYLVNLYSKQRLQSDVERLKDQCDAIIVSMHWGIEYQTIPSEEQRELAQLLADLGVDVVIGEHPHVLQPIEWVEGKEGNRMLVIYSLGNFLSAQDSALSMLGGLASWNMIKDGETGEISIEDVSFMPTVTHFTSGFQNFKVYALKDYTDELAQAHGLNGYAGEWISRAYFSEMTHQIMDEEFLIVE